MKIAKLLLPFILHSYILYGQIDLQENNKKLFSYLSSDSLYEQTGNVIFINLSDFPKENRYYYRCSGAKLIAKARNIITICPTRDSVLLEVLMEEYIDPTKPKGNKLVIGKKTFWTKPVPSPNFYIKTDSTYLQINDQDAIFDLSLPIFIAHLTGLEKAMNMILNA